MSTGKSILRESRRSIVRNGKKYEIDLSVIPDKVVEYLRNAFNDLDYNKSGKIGVDELQEFLDNNGVSMDRDQVILNFFENDKDGDLELDFEEFASRMGKISEIKNDPVIEAFKNFAGKSKFIDAIQLKRILIKLGNQKFTDEEVDTVFKELGIKLSDKIEYESFVTNWREKANLKFNN